MRRRTGHYEISLLIADSLKEISATQLASRLKYKNISKMLNQLEAWLTCGRGDDSFFKRLRKAQLLPEDLVLPALAASDVRHKSEEKEAARKIFEPSIFVHTESEVVGGFFAGMMTRDFKRIKLGLDFCELSRKEALLNAKELIQAHAQKYGLVHSKFGKVLGYTVHYQFEKKWKMDVNGHLKGG